MAISEVTKSGTVAATSSLLTPSIINAADIAQVLARFTRAYDAGDFKALTALIDPDVVRDDRMVFTLANFNRVFRETSSRSIELKEIKHSIGDERTSVQLATKTVTDGDAPGLRTETGRMTLVMRKRGDATLIAELQYGPLKPQ